MKVVAIICILVVACAVFIFLYFSEKKKRLLKVSYVEGEVPDVEVKSDKGDLHLVSGRISISIKNLMTVGRDDGCDLVVMDPLVSRRHCKIGRLYGVYVLKDMGSTNGTYLNGGVIPEDKFVVIKPGDEIVVGYTNMFVR